MTKTAKAIYNFKKLQEVLKKQGFLDNKKQLQLNQGKKNA